MPATPISEAPPAVLQLAADPQRWRVLAELARSDRRVGELCELLGKPQNLVSYHVAQLRQGGLIGARRSSADGRDTYYRIDLQHCRTMFAAAGAALHPGIQLVPTGPSGVRAAGRRTSRVLFLCTGNSARSQIAAALLEHHAAGIATARSAGSHPKSLHPNAVRVLAERGIDIAGRPTTDLRRYARQRFDHVITLCDRVREVCPEFPGQPTTAHWSMPDPSIGGDDQATYPAFVSAAEEIEIRVEFLLAAIVTDISRGKDQS